MHWRLYYLVLLRQDLNFKDYWLQESLEPPRDRGLLWRYVVHLGWCLTKLTVVLAKLEMNTIPDNFEFMNSKLVVEVSHLCLLANVRFGPVRLDCLLALVVYKLAAQPETGAHYIVALEWKPAQNRMWLDHIANDMHWLLMDVVYAIVNFDVGLECFDCELLTAAALNLDQNWEWKLFQRWYFVTEVARMLVNWYPDCHCMGLHQAVESVDVETLVDVALKSHNVLKSTAFIPVLKLVVQPPILFKDFESFLTPQKLWDENVHVVGLHFGWVFVVLDRCIRVVLCQELLLLKVNALHLDQRLNILGFKQEVNGYLVEAGLLKHTKCNLFDLLVSFKQVVAEERQAPPIEVKIALPV
jgi:hypothetical protein